MKILLLSLTAIYVATVQGWCYPEEYGPFQLSQEPKAFPIKACLISANDGHEVESIFIRDTNASERIVIFQSEKDDQYYMAIERQSGEILLGYIKIDINALYNNDIQVYWGFLNEDNKPDYIVQIWCGGNGLNAVLYYTYFLLSSGNSFHCSKTGTFYPGPMDFIDINRDGRPEYVQTAFVYGEKGKDGKVHNYWVYNLFQFKGDQVISANNLDSRFPCWVWYTDKPNHKNTSQLTDEQKRRLWKNHASYCFPVSAELTNE